MEHTPSLAEEDNRTRAWRLLMVRNTKAGVRDASAQAGTSGAVGRQTATQAEEAAQECHGKMFPARGVQARY